VWPVPMRLTLAAFTPSIACTRFGAFLPPALPAGALRLSPVATSLDVVGRSIVEGRPQGQGLIETSSDRTRLESGE
jgi:hypothetical protein